MKLGSKEGRDLSILSDVERWLARFSARDISSVLSRVYGRRTNSYKNPLDDIGPGVLVEGFAAK